MTLAFFTKHSIRIINYYLSISFSVLGDSFSESYSPPGILAWTVISWSSPASDSDMLSKATKEALLALACVCSRKIFRNSVNSRLCEHNYVVCKSHLHTHHAHTSILTTVGDFSVAIGVHVLHDLGQFLVRHVVAQKFA